MNTMAQNGELVVIERIKKDEGTFVQLAAKKLDGRSFFEIRVYFVNGKGHEIPTTKGVTFGPKSVLKLRRACDDAIRIIKGGDLL